MPNQASVPRAHALPREAAGLCHAVRLAGLSDLPAVLGAAPVRDALTAALVRLDRARVGAR